MLVSLSIRDVVLIERLDLSFDGGLSVFTGETGAGKSILLDSLNLALGARADTGLIRHSVSQLSVTAAFDPPSDHPARAVLKEHDIDCAGEQVVVRRVVTNDGRSRAFVNDQPVSVGLLRRLGDEMVEIHGQFESHGLLDPSTHLQVLDAFVGAQAERNSVRDGWRVWQEALEAQKKAEAEFAKSQAEEAELKLLAEDLTALVPKPGEEEELAARRNVLMHAEKLVEAMNGAMAALSAREVDGALRSAQRLLERVAERAEGRLDGVIAALDRAAVEAAEAVGLLERASADISLDPKSLEQVEERLFALRAAARKFGTDVDGLVGLLDATRRRLEQLESGGEGLLALAKAEQKARTSYVEAARKLSAARQAAAAKIDSAVARELPPLKLEHARFLTRMEPLPESSWGANGVDKVEFLVATNPGTPPGPLGKIASGGELARFMLALKVVLARTSSIPTIVFDEVDAGIGGRVAAAVGERLAQLGSDIQVLVVTHSPQVAAKGEHHYRVVKSEAAKGVATDVEALSAQARREEIARMLAGETVTEQARAAADSLLTLI